MLRFVFLMVLGCHIPFIFFTGKEATLIIIDEWDRSSISSALDAKIIEEPSLMVNNEDIDEGKQVKRRQSLAYKEMNMKYYYVSTILLFYLEILGAIFLNDIGLIFEFISAIAISCIAFLFPGVFYLMAERKYAT